MGEAMGAVVRVVLGLVAGVIFVTGEVAALPQAAPALAGAAPVAVTLSSVRSTALVAEEGAEGRAPWLAGAVVVLLLGAGAGIAAALWRRGSGQ